MFLGQTLTVRWFDRKQGPIYTLVTSDDIPCDSVFEDFYPIIDKQSNGTWKLENEKEIKEYIASYKKMATK